MNTLRVILSALASTAVVWWLLQKAEPSSHNRQHDKQVIYHRGYKALVFVFLPLSAFVTYAALLAADDQRRLALLFAGGFWAATLYLVYEVFLVKLSFDDTFIYHYSPLHGSRTIPWADVNGLKASVLMRAFIITTVSPYASGHASLIERICVKLGYPSPFTDDV